MLINKNNKVLFIIASIIVLLLYNLILFFVPFQHTMTFWMGYGFTMIGVIAAIVMSCIILVSSDTKTITYRYAEIRTFLIYLPLQFILGFLWAALAQVPHQYPSTVNLVVIALIALYIIRVELAVRVVSGIDNAYQEKHIAMENLQTILIEAQEQVLSDNTRSVINALLFDLKGSDPITPPEAAEYDEDLAKAVMQIRELVNCGDEQAVIEQCHLTTIILKKRNRKVLQYK